MTPSDLLRAANVSKVKVARQSILLTIPGEGLSEDRRGRLLALLNETLAILRPSKA